MKRNLVLLLTSGHTVRIELRDDELPDGGGIAETAEFVCTLPAVVVSPFEFEREPLPGTIYRTKHIDKAGKVAFAYIEDPSLPDFPPGAGLAPPDDFQRITVETPGAVISHGN